MRFLHWRLYEAAHKKFRKHYGKTLIRRRTPMREIISRRNIINSLSRHSQTECRKKSCQNRCKMVEVRQDIGKFVEHVKKATLSDLLRLTETKKKGTVAGIRYAKRIWMISMEWTAGYDGMRVLCRLLFEEFYRREVHQPASLHHTSIISALAYICGMTVTTLKAKMIHGAVVIK